jgi:hypothetical protein
MGAGLGAGLSRTSPIRRSAKGLGREGKPTTRLVRGVRGDVVAPRVYIAGGGDTRRAEIGGNCLDTGVSMSRVEGPSDPLPRETAEVEAPMAREGLVTSLGREMIDVFLSTVTMVA